MSRVQCPNCPKTYASKGGLKQHMDKHHSEPGSQPKYDCQFCNRSHACSSNLSRHLLSCKGNPDKIRPDEGRFVCKHCACLGIHRAFKANGGLFSHCNKHHQEVTMSPSASSLPKPPTKWTKLKVRRLKVFGVCDELDNAACTPIVVASDDEM